MKLCVENASFGYKSEEYIIKNLNLTLNSGELVAVLGPNGAGKTTLLKCIMGFLKWNKGLSTLDGEDISKMNQKKFWQNVSYVPQAKGTSSSMKTEDMILLGLADKIGVFSQPKKADYEKVDRLMQRLNISYLMGKKCNEISGGELQMVLIARALINEPKLLILDEPESNLDFRNQLIVLNTMSELAHSENIGCIFNTHYPTHALSRADKSLLLPKNGEAVFGETAKIVTEENIESVFGVKAVIGEVETEENVYKNIMPLQISDDKKADKQIDTKENVIAVVAVIFSDYELADKINKEIHAYNQYVIGRMGIPYREAGVYIINFTLDAPKSEAEVLTHRLSVLGNVSIKTTFAQKRCSVDE